MDGDDGRYLHRNATRNYTTIPALGAPGEQECVSASEQERQTAAARRTEEERRRDAWKPARSLISAGLVSFGPAADVSCRRDLRLIERSVERIDQRLGA